MKAQFKPESNDSHQMIEILDRIDELLEQFLKDLSSLLINPDTLLLPEIEPSKRSTLCHKIEVSILILLKATGWILLNRIYNKVYKSLDRILKILVLCDDFEVLEQCMLLIYGYFSDDAISTMDYNYINAQAEMEDLLYICKYALYHRNSFHPESGFQYTDYFQDDAKYQNFHENILKGNPMNTNILYDTSLEFQFLSQQQIVSIKETSLTSYSFSKHAINSLETALFLLEDSKKNLSKEIHWNLTAPCKNKRVFYGLLYRIKFSRNHNSYPSRIKAVNLILSALQAYVALTKTFSVEKNELLNTIFVTNLDLGNVLKDILSLFHLELTPEFHTKILESMLNILSLDEHFDFKEYINQINNQFLFLQKLLKDCLSRTISYGSMDCENKDNCVLSLKREKTPLLIEKTALDPKFLKKLLILLKKEIKKFYLDEDNNIITTKIYSICTLLGSLMEINDSEPFLHNDTYYFPYSYKHLLNLNEILYSLIPNQDLLNNYNLFQKLIDRLHRDLKLLLSLSNKNEYQDKSSLVFDKNTDKSSLFDNKNTNKYNYLTPGRNGQWEPLKVENVADFVEYMIKLIDSPFFRKISMRNQMVPTLARKIADSSIVSLLKQLIESPLHQTFLDKIFLQTITLVGDIAREIPGLIERLIELGIMKAILVKLCENMPRNVEAIPMIIYFINMLCLNEKGQAMEFETDALAHVFKLFLKRDFLDVLSKNIGYTGNKCPSSMAYELLEMLNGVEKMKQRTCELILWTFQQFIALQEHIIGSFDLLKSNQKFIEIETTVIYLQKTNEISDNNNDKNPSIDLNNNNNNSECYQETFPFNKNKPALDENHHPEKEFVETLKDYNKILQNFLRFFSRFFSVNCNIIDELINGHCIDYFLKLMDSPLLLFGEKASVAHSFSNCFKVFIMNIYKLDLSEKVSEELQKALLWIEQNLESPMESLVDFSRGLSEELLLEWLDKGIINEEISIQGKLNVLGKLFFLENLGEFLRLLMASKHMTEEGGFTNETLLSKVGLFLRALLRQIERIRVCCLKSELQKRQSSPEESKKLINEPLQKMQGLNLSLFQILRKVFVQNVKEAIELQIKNKNDSKKTSNVLEILVSLLLDCLNKDKEPFDSFSKPLPLIDFEELEILCQTTLYNQPSLFHEYKEPPTQAPFKPESIGLPSFITLLHHYNQLSAFQEIAIPFLELYKKNFSFHPEFFIVFYRHFGFEKILSYLKGFLRVTEKAISPQTNPKPNVLYISLLRNIHDELLCIIKPLFFHQVEIGYRVYIPETDKFEENESLLEFIDFLTLESLNSLIGVLIEVKELYFLVKFNDFKPLLEILLGLLLKALKLSHHSRRKPIPKRQRPLGMFLMEDLMQMGFAKERVLEALENVEIQTIQNLTEWLLTNPEKDPNSKKKEEEEEKENKGIENILSKGTKLCIFDRKEMKAIKPEVFTKERQGLLLKIAGDLVEKLVYLGEFEKPVLDFLVFMLEKPEFEECRKQQSNKFIYLILRCIKSLSASSFSKKFNFKIGLKGNKELLEKIRHEGELIKPLSDYLQQEIPLNYRPLQSIACLLSFYGRISEKFLFCDKTHSHLKPILELLKLTEKSLESSSLKTEEPSVQKILQDLITKVLLLSFQALKAYQHYVSKGSSSSTEKPKKSPKKKDLRSNDSKNEVPEIKELLERLIPLIIQILTLQNQTFQGAIRTSTGCNNTPGFSLISKQSFYLILVLLKLAFQIPNYHKEALKLFLGKKGLSELFKLRSPGSEYSGYAEPFLQILEALFLGDDELVSVHYELEIKRFFLEKKSPMENSFKSNIPLTDYLSFMKALPLVNLDAFEAVTKQVCVKKNGKNESGMSISLRKEKCDMTHIITKSFTHKQPRNIALTQSLFQPFPQNYILYFSENGVLLSLASGNTRNRSSNKASLVKPKELNEGDSKEKKVSSHKKGKKERLEEESSILSMNYQPNDQINSIICLILDSILTQFIEEISKEEANTSYGNPISVWKKNNPNPSLFNYHFLLKILHAILHKFPILSPFILRFNCSKYLTKPLKQRFDLDNKEISFLSFLIKVLIPLTLDKFRHLLFEMCLDSYLFYPISENNSEIVPFSQEVRKKVLLELFLSLDKELVLAKSNSLLYQLSPKNDLFSLITLHLYLLPIREIARLSLCWNSEKFPLNFFKLYEEFFKLFSIKDVYLIETKLPLLKEPLSVLYQYLLAFLMNKKGLQSSYERLMPVGLLSKKSSFVSEWEFMMNPTFFIENSLEDSHLDGSSQTSSSDNDLSIETFMNDFYQYQPEDLHNHPEGGDLDQFIEEEDNEESQDYPIGEMPHEEIGDEGTHQDLQEGLAGQEAGEQSRESVSSEGQFMMEESSSSGQYDSQSSNSNEDDDNDSLGSDEDDDENNEEEEENESRLSEEEEDEVIGGGGRENRRHSYYGESSEEDDEEDDEDESDEDDELIEIQTERGGNSPRGNHEFNRRRFLGSVNLIFRRDRRLEPEERRPGGRLRLRKLAERKKKLGGERSLASILSFDYLQFDPEIQRINDDFLDLIKKFYHSPIIALESIEPIIEDSWIYSLRMKLYPVLSQNEESLFFLKDSFNSLFPSMVSEPREPVLIPPRVSAPQSRFNWEFLMNPGNGMVMFVPSGREQRALMDIASNPILRPEVLSNNNNSNPQQIPQPSNMAEVFSSRRLIFQDFWNNLRREEEPELSLGGIEGQRSNINSLNANNLNLNHNFNSNHYNMEENIANNREFNEIRERLIRELNEDEDQEEEEKKENKEHETTQLDPIFFNIMNEEFKEIEQLSSNFNNNTNNNLRANISNTSNNNNFLTPNNNNTNANINTNANTNTNINTNINNNNNSIEIPLQTQSLLPQSLSIPDLDNANFFASLPPHLREEVILSSDPAFLGTLPPEILNEFQSLRASHPHARSFNPFLLEPESSSHLSSSSGHHLAKKKPIKKERKIPMGLHKEKEQLLKNPSSRLLIVEEKLLENIMSFLYVDSLAFAQFPYNLMKAIMTHPLNEMKILDCFLGLLKGELQPEDLLERDCLIRDKDKVFLNISLKILTILTVYTEHSISGYFLEKSHKPLLVPERNEGFCVLEELIGLFGNMDFLNNYMHLKLLVSLISNISKKVKVFNEKKAVESEKFKLQELSVVFLCKALNSDLLDDKSLRNLNNIISVFSLNKTNLEGFVGQMKCLLLGICQKMNGSLEENLQALRKLNLNKEATLKDSEESVINKLETEVEEEHKIYRIFKIIKKLFEKCLLKAKKSTKNVANLEEKDKPENNPTIELEEEKLNTNTNININTNNLSNNELLNAELRKIFHILISDRALNNVWINVTELLILINEVCPKSINLSNPIIHKMTPIIESFFIIYRILNDEDASFEYHSRQSSHALRRYYSKKTMPEISAIIHSELQQQTEELEATNFLIRREQLSFNDMFTIMCEKNKNIINLMVKQNIALLNESFSMIIRKMPRILDFDNKKSYFRSELKKIKPPSYPALRLKVRRSNVFIESYNVFRSLSTEELRRKLVIEFINEPGVDQGGLIREFYSLLSKEIFNPGYCLFKTSANNVTFQPSPQSHINDQHLNYFKFVGRIFGKALHDGYMMDAFFTRSFYKHMLGQSLSIYDMEDIDPEYFKNLKWVLENDIFGFDLTFSYEADNFGEIEIVDLIPNGRNIVVTEENKLDYVQKICYAKMAKDIQEQIKKFLEGFHELIPPSLVSIFDSRELELMISGLPDIDSKFF